jgi:CSLREA domain-containing protein
MSRHLRCALILATLLALALGVGSAPQGATAQLGPDLPDRSTLNQQYFEVNSTADNNMAHDKNPGDCLCLSWFDECTLRAAIEEANVCVGADTIAFHSSLQGGTIYLDSGEGALPSLAEQVTVSAQSIWDHTNNRPGLVLHGGNGDFDGLALLADGCAIYGLYITAFQQAGVYVNRANNNIGGPYVGQRNILSGNGGGILILGATAHHNSVQGNWIGLTDTGDGANPNADGIAIGSAAHDNTIGGSNASEGNVISGNTQRGVIIFNTGADGNRLGGNIVGLAADGLMPLANGWQGVYVGDDTQNTTIGDPLAGNKIASNGRDGVYVQYASQVWIQGNTINSNGWGGVNLNGSHDNQILANTIAYNTLNGVLVEGAAATGNLIVANSIHGNGLKGIALSYDGNGNLPAPSITSATPTHVEGTACANCMVHIYSDSAEEGEIYHGSANADAGGSWVYTDTISGPNATATNTDGGNNTSEFSAPVVVAPPCTPVGGVTISGPTVGGVGVAVCFTATVTPGNATLPIDYLWDPVPDGQGNSYVCYTWFSAGTYVITVTASNCSGAGQAEDTHTITIGDACTPVSGVDISGPAAGDVGVPVCFTTTVTPANATPPIEYLWDPIPGSGQNTAVACYTWSSPGTYVITATTGNCGGAGIAQDTHTITIGGACVPVTGVTIAGPASGLVGVPYGFNATVAPANATLPIAYTWTPAPGSGQGTVNASYTWSAAGTYNISVAVSNCSGTGTGSDNHGITIVAGTVYQVYLPVVARQ